MNYLRDLKVLVLGLGDSGLAMAQWCARFGADVTVWDSRDAAPQAEALAASVPDAKRLSGALEPEALAGIQLVLKSPGLAPNDARIAPLLDEAAAIGIAVQGELDLLARALAELKTERGYAPKVIAITGTNGKTTTTAMTAQLIERAGKRVAMAGNIGPSMLTVLAEALDKEPAPVPAAPDAVRPEPVEGSAPVRPEPVEGSTTVRPEPVEGPASVHPEPVEGSTSVRPEPVEGSTSVRPEPVEGSTSVRPEPVEGSGQTAVPGRALRRAQDERKGTQDERSLANDGGASEAVFRQAQDERDSAPAERELAHDERDSTPAEQDSVQAERESVQDERDSAPAELESAQNERAPNGPPADLESDDDAPLELIAPPPPAPVFEHLPEVWVLELSSFQLDRVRGFEPSAGVVLNLSQDHLDWHGTMPAYAAAKGRVYGDHATMIVNRDDLQVESLVEHLTAPPAPAKGVKTMKARAPKPSSRRIVRFGLDAPRRHGDFGLVVENGMAWLVRAHEADETMTTKRRGRVDADDEIHLQRLMPADALRIRGRHNAANALAALALATAVGCALAPMLHGLRDYAGEPHRVEFIATVDGIDAFDDSKGTNVGATVAAIEGLGADRAPSRLVLLLGGDGKGQDFKPLLEPLRRHARAVATLGRDAERIEAVIASSGLPMQRHATLEAATRWAFAQAKPGDAVVLSPACASLDMFRNYAHRAEVFVSAVRALALEQGAVA